MRSLSGLSATPRKSFAEGMTANSVPDIRSNTRILFSPSTTNRHEPSLLKERWLISSIPFRKPGASFLPVTRSHRNRCPVVIAGGHFVQIVGVDRLDLIPLAPSIRSRFCFSHLVTCIQLPNSGRAVPGDCNGLLAVGKKLKRRHFLGVPGESGDLLTRLDVQYVDCTGKVSDDDISIIRAEPH